MEQLKKNVLEFLEELKKELPEEVGKEIKAFIDSTKIPKDRLEKFRKILTEAKNNIAIILSHLDPDSIACARVFAEICKEFGKNPNIYFAGILDDPQNKHIKNSFNLADDFQKLEDFIEKNGLDTYNTVLLDSSSLEDSRLGKLKIDPIIIIDHHTNESKLEEANNNWYWIQAYGAAISMVVKLYLDLGLNFKLNDELSTLSAIALLTDADIRLLSPHMTKLDYSIFNYLTEYMNSTDANKTFATIFDMKYVKLLVTAFNNIVRNENVVITHFEYMPREDLGYLARLADELCRIKEIDTVFLWVVSDDTLYVKARSKDEKLELNDYIKQCFGEKFGGAKHGKGAAQIPLGFCSPSENSKDELMNYMKKRIKDAIKL